MSDRAAGAARLKALRKSRGLSLAETARALIAIAENLGQPRSSLPSVAGLQRSVARWESARPSRPDERHQLLLAHLYARRASGGVCLGSGSDFAELSEALAYLGEGEHRLASLRLTLLRTATERGDGILALLPSNAQSDIAKALVDPTRLDTAIARSLMEVVTEVNSAVGSLPFVRLQLVLTPVLGTCRQLLAASLPASLRTALLDTAVTAATLAGRLAFETRDDVASRALYAEASRQADHLAPWRRANVGLSHALVTLYSAPGTEGARLLVSSAVQDATTGGSRVVRARAHALQAEIAARARQGRQAQDALRLAWYDLDRAGDEGHPAPISFSPAHLHGFEGLCELYTGSPVIAHDRFETAAAALGAPRERVQRAIVRTDQALALVRMGEPEAAASLLHECVSAAAETGGRVCTMRLARARRELRPWRLENWVVELDDRLLDLLES
ncbi:hypothetical protein [Streptomyces lichenis]|uniref:Helix-turn-helix transcriptional regulator n=1 Tax=Streptomyces lichenis TaxID=2306967 RepID=A0ABT0I5S2_9ACTN|nr:hypothetical protein [Streptomyces lichenis]MCK8676664.1 hypothetical protein [Streptomyces lichenis]